MESRPDSVLSNTVLKSLDVLECLATSGHSMTASEIAKACEISRPTAYRLLATLQSRGYVSNVEHGYKLGYKILSLGGVMLDSIDLAYEAYPYLQRLSELSGETAYLSLLDGVEALLINKVESKQPMRVNAMIGTRSPLYSTSVGKAMLAYLPAREQDVLLESMKLHPFTQYTITDKAILVKELVAIHQQGYAFEDLEMDENVRSIATPVFNYVGYPIGAISLAGPSDRLPAQKLHNLALNLMEATQKMSRLFGYVHKNGNP